MEKDIIMEIIGSSGKTYTIKFSGTQNRWICNCPDYLYRRSKEKDGKCKHIITAEKEMEKPSLTDRLDPRYKPISAFEKTAQEIRELCEGFQFEICGSYRRRQQTIKDLDVIVYASTLKEFDELMERIKLVAYVESGGTEKITCKFGEIQVDFRICKQQVHWGSMLAHFTGSKGENIRLRQIAKAKGWKLSEYGLENEQGVRIAGTTEESIYMALQEPYKQPWER
jgi:DNA polymerase (family 10)